MRGKANTTWHDKDYAWVVNQYEPFQEDLSHASSVWHGCQVRGYAPSLTETQHAARLCNAIFSPDGPLSLESVSRHHKTDCASKHGQLASVVSATDARVGLAG